MYPSPPVGLINDALYPVAPVDHLQSLLPETFHEALRGLILQIIRSHIDEWSLQSKQRRMVSDFPQLQHSKCQVYRKSFADSGGTRPVALLSLELEQTSQTEAARDENVVHVELEKDMLDTIISGMHIIKEQLSKV